MQKLILAEDVYDVLESGEKACTIRKGRRDIQLGELQFESLDEKRTQTVDVITVAYSKLQDISDDLVWEDGFDDHDDMVEKMKRFYPDITLESECTAILFNVETEEINEEN